MVWKCVLGSRAEEEEGGGEVGAATVQEAAVPLCASLHCSVQSVRMPLHYKSRSISTLLT